MGSIGVAQTEKNEEHHGGYSVSVQRRESVAAALPLQEHWLPFSNLDLLLPPVDVGVFFCYRNNEDINNAVSVLKASLAKVLVTFYPFAGEVVTNSAGEPELNCNNRGVDFIEAYADVDLRDLRLHNPDISIENKLVPKKKEGVLCVQATKLRCGGLVVACKFDHRIADAYSANMFLVSWAEMAAGKPPSFLPSFRRSLLSPRRPVSNYPSLDRLYVPISSLPPPPLSPPNNSNNDVNDLPVNRIYYVCGDDIARMQAEASSAGPHRRTKLEAFSAYLWRIIGRATADHQNSNKEIMCRLGVVVDGRSRLQNNIMANYFGNVLSIPFSELELGKLQSMELQEVADAVHEALEEARTEDHFRGLIDWVETHRPEPALAKIYCSPDGPAVVVSSGQRFPVREVDFGWGQPLFGSYHFPWDSTAGYVMPMPSAIPGDSGWVVYMHLPKRYVDALEAVAGHIFCPIEAHHLGLGDHQLNISHAAAAAMRTTTLLSGATAATSVI